MTAIVIATALLLFVCAVTLASVVCVRLDQDGGHGDGMLDNMPASLYNAMHINQLQGSIEN